MSTTHTASSVLTDHGISDASIEHPDAEVRILTGPQRQGDVMVLPVTDRDVIEVDCPECKGTGGVPNLLGDYDLCTDCVGGKVKTKSAHVGGEPLGSGITVARAETSQANTHSLHGAGTWAPNPHAGSELLQGWLTVPEGGEAFLIHTEEHSALGIGAGTYEVRRQREYAGEWRRVAD